MRLRRLPVSLRAGGVIVCVLFAVAAGALTIRSLETDAVRARDNEAALLSLRLDLFQMRDMPWDAGPDSGVKPADARGELVDAIRTANRKLDRLGDLPNGALVHRRLAKAEHDLWQLFAAVRHGDSAGTDTYSNSSAVEMYAVDGAMHRASLAYRARASHTLARARLGAAAVIGVLFALFAWFYVGAFRGRRRAEALEHERERLFHRAADAAEEERRRLAVDLHDGPIQQLAAIALKLDLVQLRGGEGGSELLSETREGVGEQVETLRQLMVELRPPALDTVGLVGAIRDHLVRYERRTGIRTELVTEVDHEVADLLMQTTLYRVVQEALANVWKHARAGLVRVTLRTDGDGIHVEVVDDGVGFTERADGSPTMHVGLTLMRERVERAGGRWRLDSALGRGTAIEAVLPG